MADLLSRRFGTQIRSLRKSHEDSAEGLAEKLCAAGVTVTEEEIRSWEKGKEIPGRETLAALCNLYECEFYTLFGVKNEEEFRALGPSVNLSTEEALAWQLAPIKMV